MTGQTANTPPQDARVARFCADLAVLEPSEVIRKHITTGNPVSISEEQYVERRKLVAKEFELHPTSVVLVGSCRTGFSIAPKTRYRLATSNSDLDLAIVSFERFDSYWDDVFAYSSTDRAWRNSREYREFARMLFNGWIDPRGLPNVPTFTRAAKWTTFFDGLMQSRRFGRRRISARLYRTWTRLEAFQETAIRQCRASLGGIAHA